MFHDTLNCKKLKYIKSACFAPTSMGIALNVLRTGHVLNTPTGQLIIAAAVLDDVIALMLLSVLQEFSGGAPTWYDILIPIIVSPALILLFGFIAIKISPSIIKYVMDKINDLHIMSYIRKIY